MVVFFHIFFLVSSCLSVFFYFFSCYSLTISYIPHPILFHSFCVLSSLSSFSVSSAFFLLHLSHSFSLFHIYLALLVRSSIFLSSLSFIASWYRLYYLQFILTCHFSPFLFLFPCLLSPPDLFFLHLSMSLSHPSVLFPPCHFYWLPSSSRPYLLPSFFYRSRLPVPFFLPSVPSLYLLPSLPGLLFLYGCLSWCFLP